MDKLIRKRIRYLLAASLRNKKIAKDKLSVSRFLYYYCKLNDFVHVAIFQLPAFKFRITLSRWTNLLELFHSARLLAIERYPELLKKFPSVKCCKVLDSLEQHIEFLSLNEESIRDYLQISKKHR